MSLLEEDITRKGQEFLVPEFESGNNKEYEVETIQDSIVYAKQADRHFPGLYYCNVMVTRSIDHGILVIIKLTFVSLTLPIYF